MTATFFFPRVKQLLNWKKAAQHLLRHSQPCDTTRHQQCGWMFQNADWLLLVCILVLITKLPSVQHECLENADGHCQTWKQHRALVLPMVCVGDNNKGDLDSSHSAPAQWQMAEEGTQGMGTVSWPALAPLLDTGLITATLLTLTLDPTTLDLLNPCQWKR